MKISRSPDSIISGSIVGLGEAKSIPLDAKGLCRLVRGIEAEVLHGLSAENLSRTNSPGLVLPRPALIVGFAMEDGVSLIINGMGRLARRRCCWSRAPPLAKSWSGKPNLIGFVNFDTINDRGWPGEADSASIDRDPARQVRSDSDRDARRPARLASHSPETTFAASRDRKY